MRATLAAIVFAAAAGACGQDSEAGNWQFHVDTLRAGGGVRETSWLRVMGKEGPKGEPRTKAVVLSFDCSPEDRRSTIMTAQALRQGSTETRLTVDADTSRRISGFAGTTASGGQVVLSIAQDSMLALLDGHRSVLIEYADGAGSSRTTAEFSVAGLEQYSVPFLESCAKRGGGGR
jgi:hypothetical protein